MDLGKAKLLRTGLNALHHAIHPVHGLAWTDGKQVILTALQFYEEPKFGNSVVVGHFEHVLGLNWGPVFGNDMPALLAVQHRKHVTVWRLFYDPLEKSKLIVSQTCEIGNPFHVLPNGCVWHPFKDIVVVLTKRDFYVLHSTASNSEHVKEDIKGGGVIRCACWTRDGCRLVLAVDSALHSYIWDDAQKTFTPCSFCPVFDIDGTIDAIQPTRGNQVVVTSGIPTDDIHRKKNMPSDGSSIESSLLILDKELSLNHRRTSTDSGRSEPADLITTSPLLSLDISQILARHRKSDPSHLIHFRHKFFSNGAKPRVSRLVIVSFEKNSTTARKISIPGIASPDILAIDSHATRVAIASNTSNHCLVYPITPSSRSGIQEVKLVENERAKGMCFLTDTILLVMVGQQKPVDVRFLPFSDTERYLVHLTCKRIMASEISSLPRQSGENSKSDRIHSSYALDNTILCGETLNKELLMPSSFGVQPSNEHKKVNEGIIRDNPCEKCLTSDIEDLQVKPMSRRMLRTKQNPNDEDLIRTSSLGLHDHQKPSNMSENDHDSSEKDELVSLAPNLVNDKQIFSDDYVGHCDMKDVRRNYTKFHPYPFSEDPDYVAVVYQEKKSILLCHGKLPLRTLQQCFQITSVEMKLGPVWITVTEDGEGFIPLIFRANQEVIIRNATPTKRNS
uniref:WD repeat and coiled-coil-containing protein n=1 Tax=Leptobrachium leishanense TaxID=445787 RepID=A0A8C5PB09_9ANUR